jgi:sugar phosphate isomerase/epimerase
MKLGICSYSFHRMFEAGSMEAFSFITLCHELGCTQLDPLSEHILPALEDTSYRKRLAAAAAAVGLPFGCIAADFVDVYEPDPVARQAYRERAYRWLDVLAELGARQVRIEAGNPAEMSDEVFHVLVSGYTDLVARGREGNLEVLVENHRGALQQPENIARLLEAVDGLGFLFDTNNWASGKQLLGWEMCAPYASATHVKTFMFDEKGNDPTVDVHQAIHLLQASGYDDAWGIESTPHALDEIEGVRRAIALVRRIVAGRE